MDRVTEVTRDCFSAVFQLRRLREESRGPELLHQRMRRFVDELLEKASDEGFNQADAQDMAYAIVALVDEVALNQSEAIRTFWMRNLLQTHYFNENQAGDGFFVRLKSVREDPGREEVLRVYYLCLLFGFQGRYSVRGGEVERMEYIDQLSRELTRGRRRVDAEVLSPSALPPSEGFGAVAGNRTMLFAAVGAVVFAVMLFGGLKIGISSSASGLAEVVAAGETR